MEQAVVVLVRMRDDDGVDGLGQVQGGRHGVGGVRVAPHVQRAAGVEQQAMAVALELDAVASDLVGRSVDREDGTGGSHQMQSAKRAIASSRVSTPGSYSP